MYHVYPINTIKNVSHFTKTVEEVISNDSLIDISPKHSICHHQISTWLAITPDIKYSTDSYFLAVSH